MKIFVIYRSICEDSYTFVESEGSTYEEAFGKIISDVKDDTYVYDGDFYTESYVLRDDSISEDDEDFSFVESESDVISIVSDYNDNGNENDPYAENQNRMGWRDL